MIPRTSEANVFHPNTAKPGKTRCLDDFNLHTYCELLSLKMAKIHLAI